MKYLYASLIAGMLNIAYLILSALGKFGKAPVMPLLLFVILLIISTIIASIKVTIHKKNKNLEFRPVMLAVYVFIIIIVINLWAVGVVLYAL